MKKIFRMSLVLALACGALMYTGCTKDYGADIAQVKKDLDALKTGEVSSLADQVKALQGNVQTLQQAKEQLESAVKDLQGKAATDEAAIKKNQEDIKTLDGLVKAMNQQITSLENTIKSIQTDYATKNWVNSTFATLTQLSAVQTTVGNLDKRISDLEKTMKDEDIVNRLKAVETLASTAAADAKKALGDIDAVKKDLADNYYKKGVIDGKIADMEQAMKDGDAAVMKALKDSAAAIEGRLQVLKAEVMAELTAQIAKATNEITEAYQAADKKLQEQIDEINNTTIPGIKSEIATIKSDMGKLQKALEQEVTDRKAAIEQEIKDRNAAIKDESDKINKRIDEICAKYDIKIESLGERVNSISVLPTNDPELTIVSLGSQSQAILQASFLVQPKSAVNSLIEENYTLCVKEGIVRTKGAAAEDEPLNKEYKEFVDFDVDATTGEVTVRAFVDTLSDNTKGYYFALRAEAEDTVGVYSVTSDFALAVENQAIDLANGDWYWTNGVFYVNGEQDLGIAETEWTKFSTINDDRFGTWSPVLKVAADTYMTLEDIKEQLNIDVTLTSDDVVNTHNETAYGTTVPMIFNVDADTLMNSVLNNNPAVQDEDAKTFVGDTVSFGFNNVLFNGVPVTGITSVLAGHVLTQVVKIDTTFENGIIAYWNYKFYEKSDSVAVDYSANEAWMEAINESAVAANAATWTGDRTALAEGEMFGPEAAGNNYGESYLYVDSMIFMKPAGTVDSKDAKEEYESMLANINKENSASLYKYKVPVKVQKQPFNNVDVLYEVAEPLKARIMKNDTLDIAGLISKALDADKKFYFMGLEDADKSDALLYDAFCQKGEIVAGSVKLAIGVTSPRTYYDAAVVFTNAAVNAGEFVDESKIVFNDALPELWTPGLNYGNNYTITFSYKCFDVTYNFTVTFTTAKPDLQLEFTPYLTVSGNRAEVRGDFVQDPNLYTLEQIHPSKLMRVTGAGVEAEGMSNVTVKITKVAKEEGFDTLDDPTYNTGNMAIAQADEELYNIEDVDANLIKWDNYTGLELAFEVQLYVGTEAVGEPKVFTLWTKKPVIFDRAGEVTITRHAGQTDTVALYQGCFVYGVKEGEYVMDENLVDQETGAFSTKYKDCEFVYDYSKITSKINGVVYTLVENVDFEIVDAAAGKIALKGDNVVGNVDIEVPVTLYYYLDYNHDATKVDTKVAVIHHKQI